MTHYNRYNLKTLPTQDAAVAPRTPVSSERAEYVDELGGKWIYDAYYWLVRNGVIEDTGQFRGARPITRYEFAVAIVRLTRQMRETDSFFEGGKIVMPGTKPGAFQVPQEYTGQMTGQTLNDVVAALAAEFQPEISRLGVRVSLSNPVTRIVPQGQTTTTEAPETGAVMEADIKPRHEYIWMSLSYGAKANPKLIEQIKQAVAAYAVEKTNQ
jgi:hypothetical protein